MTSAPPLPFRYIDGHMVPPSRTMADRYFSEGVTYALEEVHARSHATHAHYFAALHTSWLNLPESIADNFKNEEHLRKYALIKCGFYDSHTLVCASKAEAQRVAEFMRPLDEFGVVVAKEATVTRYIAKSQSMKAMGKVEFARSKEAVLEFLAGLIGTTPETLSQQSQPAAAE